MNKYLLYIFSLVLLSEFSLSDTKNWKLIDTRPDYNPKESLSWIQSMKCADSNTCITQSEIFMGGYYFRLTTNGGDTWNTILRDTSYYLDDWNYKFLPKIRDVVFPSTNLIMAVGDSGFVLRTTDLGKTWTSYYIDTAYKITHIEMSNEYYGIILLQPNDNKINPSKILETNDGGVSWIGLKKPVVPGIIGFLPYNIIDSNTVVISCIKYDTTINNNSTSLLMWLRNHFTIWDTVSTPIHWTIINFKNQNYGWLAGVVQMPAKPAGYYYNQYIYHTSDGGKHWETQWDSVGNKDMLTDMDFYDENFGMVGGYSGNILVTTNGGKTWVIDTLLKDPRNGEFWDVRYAQVVSNQTAYVVLNTDYVYKYTREWLTDVVENEKLKDFSVSPNPATDYISISIINRRVNPTVDKVEIYDILGILYTPPNPLLIEGEQVRLEVSGFVPGVYFVKVGDKVQRFVKM